MTGLYDEHDRCIHCAETSGTPHRCCAVCRRVHSKDATCDGRPIDWQARKARALAWGEALRAAKVHPGRGRDIPEYEVER